MDVGMNEEGRTIYQQQSRFQKQFGADYMEFDCPTGLLRKEVIRLMRIHGLAKDGSLETLHTSLISELKRYNPKDRINGITALLYDTDAQFNECYLKFIKYLRTYFLWPFYFQTTPTIRVHCPDSENSDCYPSYHADLMNNHPPEEINIWIPLTHPGKEQAHGLRLFDVKQSAIALEAFGYDYDLFQAYYDEHVGRDKDCPHAPPVTTPYDKFLAFDARCIHSVEPMLSHTRVSIDIRILPVKDLNKNKIYQSNGRRKQRYIPGEAYYEAPEYTSDMIEAVH